MALNESFLQELKYKTDIEDIVSTYVSLRKRGNTSVGLCPFHNEKTPSFTVYNDTQSFYCFGCGAGGDAIGFIKKIENLETENQELKEQLSEYKNVTPENQTSTEISETVPATSDNENDQRLMNAVVMTADVYNGSNTQIIGQRAFITIPKEVLKQISEKGYVLSLIHI